tara:strand:+ start:5132 stop:5419 length:288 start_codon:yes stop_codon:yes gene_type:complete
MSVNKITLSINGEQREYDTASFSEACSQKVAQMQFADNTILPIFSEATRLIRLGRAVDSNELIALLPKEYTVITDKNAVKSEEKKDIEENSSKDS